MNGKHSSGPHGDAGGLLTRAVYSLSFMQCSCCLCGSVLRLRLAISLTAVRGPVFDPSQSVRCTPPCTLRQNFLQRRQRNPVDHANQKSVARPCTIEGVPRLQRLSTLLGGPWTSFPQNSVPASSRIWNPISVAKLRSFVSVGV